ncbi:hypothetical protein PIB30_045311 [Stylosanthes scabra]|uniref:Pectinesterase inhibitor domain-containing protein n=1 Tax=Stylosanthes scabra TaxID=79078 RepID=A0ABU6VE09_9FABA|nr:hypothetical protein [Stylosanthes scabra]
MGGAMKIFSLLAICVITVAAQQQVMRGPELIKNMCQVSPKKDLCLKVLFSDPLDSSEADATELAIIALRVAADSASSMLDDIKVLIENPELSPDIQEALSDCKDTIMDAGAQVQDTVASLLQGADRDANTWLQAAFAAIDTCDASIPGDDDILSVKSRQLRNFVDLANTIMNSLPDKNFVH